MTASAQLFTSAAARPLAAPVHGAVIAIEVLQGQAVVAGQVLVLLESMKMEVPLDAPTAGIVHSILVAVGDVVEHGAALAEAVVRVRGADAGVVGGGDVIRRCIAGMGQRRRRGAAGVAHRGGIGLGLRGYAVEQVQCLRKGLARRVGGATRAAVGVVKRQGVVAAGVGGPPSGADRPRINPVPARTALRSTP